jgi:hypothetical protein
MKKRGKEKVDIGSTSTCNFVSTQNQDNVSAHRIDMENISFPGQRF